MKTLDREDVRAVRTKLNIPACERYEDHDWWQVLAGNLEHTPLLVICHTCGRTPLEALNELEIWP